MKRSRSLWIIVIAALLSVTISVVVFQSERDRIDQEHSHLTTFDWFCKEFGVADSSRERIRALHTAHFPECEDHCVHYADSVKTLAAINEDPHMGEFPEHVHAKEELEQLEVASAGVFRDFIHDVAEELSPEQAERYLERMGAWLSPESENLSP